MAAKAGKPTREFVKCVVEALINKGIIDGDDSNWGCTVGESINEDVPATKVIDVLHESGIAKVSAIEFDTLVNAVLMGENDCPVCGGLMQVLDVESKCVGGDGYNTPLDYEPIWMRLRCTHCGYIEEL